MRPRNATGPARPAALVLGIALVVACGTPQPSRGADLLPLPTPDARSLPPGVVQGCSDVLRPGRLAGSSDDARRVWMVDAQTGRRVDLAWPDGFGVRFAAGFDILDAAGRPISSDGDIVFGACEVGDRQALLIGEPLPGYRLACGALEVADCAIRAQQVASGVGWPARSLASINFSGRDGSFVVRFDSGEERAGRQAPD